MAYENKAYSHKLSEMRVRMNSDRGAESEGRRLGAQHEGISFPWLPRNARARGWVVFHAILPRTLGWRRLKE